MEPLPPVKEVEYRCIIGRLFDELSGMEYVTFAFETAKEFSSFRYEIAVRYKVTPGALEFRVLGMTATRTMMPAHGTARSVLRIPALQPGIYNVLLIKSDGTENQFVIEVGKKGFQILPPVPDRRFIDLVVEPWAVMQGAKMASTVSTEPPPPLIPRTIQKRQPAPPTPEEQAILDSLKTETAEERDAREEMELFGGSKRVAKSELAESAKELEDLAKGKPAAGVEPKKGAKKDVDLEEDAEVIDTPVSKTSKAVLKPTPKTEEKPAAKAPIKTESKPEPKHEAKQDTKVASKPAVKPVAKASAKPEPKHEAKTAPKPAPKQEAKPVAKPATKPAAKPAPAAAKGKVASGPIKTSASKTPAKVAPKNAPKAAPAKKASPAKSVSTKTGSAKTTKTGPAAKKPAPKKR
jgi:hypothetical protein